MFKFDFDIDDAEEDSEHSSTPILKQDIQTINEVKASFSELSLEYLVRPPRFLPKTATSDFES